MTLLRNLLVAACGLLLSAALPPNSVWPLALALVPLFVLVATSERPRQAFGLGFWFALPFFALHVLWLPLSLTVWLGPFFWVVFPLMVLALGVYWGATCWLARLVGGRGPGTLWLLPAFWVLVEWFRAQGYLGFPWGTLGYIWLDTPVGQLADTLGTYGLSLLTTAAVALLALPFAGQPQERLQGGSGTGPRVLAVLLAAILVGGGWALGLVRGRQALPEPTRRALLVQGNVDPWGRAIGASQELEVHTRLTGDGVAVLSTPPDLVIWPEGALPGYPVEGTAGAPLREDLQSRAPGSAFIVGARVATPDGKSFNSIYSLSEGQVLDRYDKRILVPFGERWPLIETAAPLYRALFGLMNLPLLQSTSTGAGFHPLLLPGGLSAAAYICYESVFPQAQLAMVRQGAEVLINVTNDAWFARGNGARQHFDMGRMRAIETRRYLLRAANDGITGVVNPLGRVEAELERGVAGTLEVAYAPSRVRTPYVRFGHLYIPILALVTLLTAIAVAFRRG